MRKSLSSALAAGALLVMLAACDRSTEVRKSITFHDNIMKVEWCEN